MTLEVCPVQLEQRHVRARRDHEVVRVITEQLGIPMELAELLIERQLASKSTYELNGIMTSNVTIILS